MRKPELIISKLDAAVRQLNTAIKLYFHFGDPVSIHSLAASSFQIIRDLSDQAGHTKSVYDQLIEAGEKLGVKDQVINAIRGPQNFFKHANGEPNETLKFSPESTVLLMYEASRMYHQLTGEIPVVQHVHRVWVICNLPEIAGDYILETQIREFAKAYGENDRTKFFNDFQKMLSHQRFG